MDERASIPPGLPRPNPTVSYWQDPPSALADHRTTADLPSSTPVLVVGSGISGAFLAYSLLSQPSPPSVLLLEARTACSGATGRNGGHTKHASYREFLDNVKLYGEAEAAKIVRFEYSCMKAVHAFARELTIQCDSWEGDTVDVIYDHWQWEKAKKAVDEIRRVLGDDDPAARYTFWDAEQTEKKFLTEGSLGAVSYEAGSLSAYKFVIGVLSLAVSKGLNLQTETPALAIAKRKGQTGWFVQTPRGEIKAEKVLLATNGYTAHLYPKLQGVIVPLRGHMTAQRPGSNLPKEGLSNTYSFIYDDGYEYMISRPRGSKFAGDIAIGGGSTKAPDAGIREFGTTDDTTTDPTILEYVQKSAWNYFGSHWGNDHPDGRLRKAWTGIMGYSVDGFPLIGPVPDEEGLFVVASFQGSGMVLCVLSAKAAVSIVNGEEDNELAEWFPRPFRITKERMNLKFRGRLHTKVVPMDLELKGQISLQS